MSPESAEFFAKAIALLPMFAVALGQGQAVSKAMEAMGRNPEAADSIFTKMIVGVALVETAAIYALVAFFTM